MSVLLSSFASLLASASLNGEDYALSSEQSAKLSYYLSLSASTEDGSGNPARGQCTFPSLQLKGSFEGKSNNNVSLVDVAAVNMASQMKVDRSSIDKVPRQLLLNVSGSFQQLLVSRIRCSMLALIDKMSKMGNSQNVDVLKRLLSSKNLLKLTTVVTSFTVIGKEKNTADRKMTAPILFETIVDCSMLGKVHTVTLQAPGTITVTINNNDNLLESVEVAFDTIAFLKTMMHQARLLVKKTIRRAAKITAAYIQMKADKNSPIGKKHGNDTVRNTGDNSSAAQTDSSSAPLLGLENQELPQFQPTPTSAEIGESKDHELICSYPAHLRETVKQFLPTENSLADASIEGFPPQLAKTLKLLSSGRFHESDDDSPCPSETDEQLWDGTSQGLFQPSGTPLPQMNESDEIVDGDGDGNPRPSKKRRQKVSFLLPENGAQRPEQWV